MSPRWISTYIAAGGVLIAALTLFHTWYYSGPAIERPYVKTAQGAPADQHSLPSNEQTSKEPENRADTTSVYQSGCNVSINNSSVTSVLNGPCPTGAH
ncbi:MAG: hypothetical protein QOD99_317 [Chthoniobacter sp.]|nr:hypothetical protein [Chthoniobacter sp.]